LRAHPSSESQFDEDIAGALQFCDNGRKPVWNHRGSAISNLRDAGPAVTSLSRGSRKGVSDMRHDEASMSAYSGQIATDISRPVGATCRANRIYRQFRRRFRGYQQYAVVTLPSGPPKP
jgi:hypothetical protein